MSGQDAALEPPPQRHFGDGAQAAGIERGTFIDVKIEVEATESGDIHDAIESKFEPCIGRSAEKGAATENAAMRRDEVDDRRQHLLVEHGVDGKQRNGLQFDASFPGRAHLGKDRPGDRRLRADRVDMGA